MSMHGPKGADPLAGTVRVKHIEYPIGGVYRFSVGLVGGGLAKYNPDDPESGWGHVVIEIDATPVCELPVAVIADRIAESGGSIEAVVQLAQEGAELGTTIFDAGIIRRMELAGGMSRPPSGEDSVEFRIYFAAMIQTAAVCGYQINAGEDFPEDVMDWMNQKWLADRMV